MTMPFITNPTMPDFNMPTTGARMGTRKEIAEEWQKHAVLDVSELKALAETAEPWDEKTRTRLSKTAYQEYFSHSYQHPRRDPDNCAACALQVRKTEPNYSGWLRLFIQAGIPPARKQWALEEAERARAENPAYFAALLRDIKTYQPSWIK